MRETGGTKDLEACDTADHGVGELGRHRLLSVALLGRNPVIGEPV